MIEKYFVKLKIQQKSNLDQPQVSISALQTGKNFFFYLTSTRKIIAFFNFSDLLVLRRRLGPQGDGNHLFSIFNSSF
jgi:hypothetical protein